MTETMTEAMTETRTILLPDRVFDGENLADKRAVVVQDKRVIEVVEASKVRAASADEVIELPGCTLLPGLIDAHVHFGPEIEGRAEARILESTELKLIKATVDAGNLLRAGFTAARDVGGRRAIFIRDAIEQGEIPGPRLRCSGRILTTVGGLEDHRYLPVEWVDQLSDLVHICRAPADAVAAVREQRRVGADLIKVFATGADLVQQFSDAELKEIVSEARRWGLKVASHAYGGPAVLASVKAGCHTLEHGSWLSEEDCRAMLRAGTILLPDLAFTHLYINAGPAYGIPKAHATEEKQRLKDMMNSALMAHQMGVRVAAGTDNGLRAFARHGAHNLLALTLLKQAGFSNIEALKAATVNAAAAMELDREIGRVEAGFRADLLAVRGDPVATLDDIHEIELVMKDGRVVRGPDTLPRKAASSVDKVDRGAKDPVGY